MTVRFTRGELANREQFGDFLNRLGLVGSAIEVGTHLGHFAESLLKTWHGQHLLCIDAYWLPLPQEYLDSEVGWISSDPEQRRKDYWEARNRLDRFLGAEIKIALADEFAATLPDHLADFIYLDASHLKPHVAANLQSYWPKLKPGGVMAGHDISGRWEGEVKPAVREFALERGIDTVYTVPGSDASKWGILDSWYFRKGQG